MIKEIYNLKSEKRFIILHFNSRKLQHEMRTDEDPTLWHQ